MNVTVAVELRMYIKHRKAAAWMPFSDQLQRPAPHLVITDAMDVLFVNKDSTTIRKKRSEQEAREINEHVNGTYARWRREQTSSIPQHHGLYAPGNRHLDITHGPKTGSLTYDHVADERKITPVGQIDQNGIIDASTNSSRHGGEGPRAYGPSSPLSTNFHGMKRSHDLQGSGTGLTVDNISTIKFATEFHIYALSLDDVPSVPIKKLWYEWWLTARQEVHRPETQLALLAWAYSSLTFVHPSSTRDRVVKGLEFRGAALQQLQQLMKSLKTQADYATALDCTLYLGCVEWQNGLLNETITHFKAAKSFLDILGGVRALPPQSQETLLWMFTNLSFTFTIRPLIHPEDLSRSRHMRDNENISSLSRMSLVDNGSLRSIIDRLIGGRLSAFLTETIELIQTSEGLVKESRSSTDKVKQLHDLYLRRLALQIKCAHLWHDMTEATPLSRRHHPNSLRSTSPVSSFRSTFCLILRLFQKLSMDSFNSMIPWKNYWIPWHDRVLDQLRPHLHDVQLHDLSHERPDHERKAKALTILWMLFTGACIEQHFLSTGARDVRKGDRVIFCSSQFTTLASKMGYRSSDDIAKNFKGSIAFSVTKQAQILKKLMQPLEHGGRGG